MAVREAKYKEFWRSFVIDDLRQFVAGREHKLVAAAQLESAMQAANALAIAERAGAHHADAVRALEASVRAAEGKAQQQQDEVRTKQRAAVPGDVCICMSLLT